MDQKTIIGIAKQYIADIYRDEGVNEIGLEEIKKDHNGDWLITIGFMRGGLSDLGRMFVAMGKVNTRVYKIIRINKNGEVEEMSNK